MKPTEASDRGRILSSPRSFVSGSVRRNKSSMAKVLESSKTIDPLRCMGKWYVQVAVPTPFDKTAHNGLEECTKRFF